MKDFSKAIYSLLAANSTLVTLTGGKMDALRRFQDQDDLDTTTAITWRRLSGNHLRDLTEQSGLCESRVEFTVWSRRNALAEQTADELRTYLVNTTGTFGGVTFCDIALANSEASYIPSDRDDDEGVYVLMLDFVIWYEESKT